MLEAIGKAMFLRPEYAVPTLIAKCKGEVAHIHESDLSTHALLSLADAQQILSKGWGERHRMSGTMAIPLGYTLLYSPRNMEEVVVLVRIVEAAVEYAKSNGRP
jgi:hypothetical protein